MGADIENSAPTLGLPSDAEGLFSVAKQRVSFLMVGTIEPRKGHAQALEAFKLVRSRGHEINLIIVGHEGWQTASTVAQLRSDPDAGKFLFWLDDASDEYLEQIYKHSDCLIAASEGEGFGLPLIEASKHEVAILARDIPVFREVAGPHAAYFSGSEPQDLAEVMVKWLEDYSSGRHTPSSGLRWSTWAECATKMARALLGDEKSVG